MEIPTYLTSRGVAQVVGKHRAVVMRLLGERQIEPAAFVDLDGKRQPLFPPETAIHVANLLSGRTQPHPNLPPSIT